MPTPGLSLFGFMDELAANNYLKTVCVVPDASDAALLRTWQEAKDLLGAPIANAGHPDIKDIPAAHLTYLQGVMANPRFADTVGLTPWSFKLVEINPLLAFQVHISMAHAPSSRRVPDLTEMLTSCLPQTLDSAKYQIGGQPTGQPTGFQIRSPDLNLRAMKIGGPFGHNPAQQLFLAGLAFGVSSPLTQVVSFNGRYYLKNGFHRAYGLQALGVSHIPCIYLEGSDWGRDVGAVGGFDQTLMESGDPPTFGHYTLGRASNVTLRLAQRVIDVKITEGVAVEP